jgi:hypothetical protein
MRTENEIVIYDAHARFPTVPGLVNVPFYLYVQFISWEKLQDKKDERPELKRC